MANFTINAGHKIAHRSEKGGDRLYGPGREDDLVAAMGGQVSERQLLRWEKKGAVTVDRPGQKADADAEKGAPAKAKK